VGGHASATGGLAESLVQVAANDPAGNTEMPPSGMLLRGLRGHDGERHQARGLYGLALNERYGCRDHFKVAHPRRRKAQPGPLLENHPIQDDQQRNPSATAYGRSDDSAACWLQIIINLLSRFPRIVGHRDLPHARRLAAQPRRTEVVFRSPV
jgi:hypothetical protein